MSFNLPSVCHNLLPHLMHGDHEVAFDEEPLLTKDKEADDSDVVSTSTDTAPHLEQASFVVPLPRPSLLQLRRTAGPTPEVQRQVAAVLQNFASGPPKPDPGNLLSAQHVYPVWCVLLYATVGPGYGTSIDFQTGAEHPNAGLHYLPAMLAGLGQAGDSKITWDGVRAGLARHQRELEDCHVYLNAISGLRALDALETSVPADRELTPADLALIKEARGQLQALVDTHSSTFLKCLEPDYIVPRCTIAAMRDVGLGGLSLLKTVPTAAVSGMATSGPLTGAARDLATTLPHISNAIGMLTGVFHLAHAVMEGIVARGDRETLLQAEHVDKNLFAEHGADFPELLELLEHRHRQRTLARLDANLLDLHGWIRGIYGGTSVGGAVVGTVLTALGGAAVFGAAGVGIPGLVGIFLAGCYMVWYGVRANVGNAEHKRHDKLERTIAAQHDRPADKMPGRAPSQGGRPLVAVARSIYHRLLAPASRESTKGALIALCIPQAEIEAAIERNKEKKVIERNKEKKVIEHDKKEKANARDADDRLVSLIVQQGLQAKAVSEADALRRHHARSDVPVWDQITGMERWLALGLTAEDIATLPTPVQPGWAQYLAPGRDMADLRKSSLTEKHIQKYWKDERFQLMLRRQCVNEQEALKTPVDAWRWLQDLRKDMRQETAARSVVAGWIHNGQLERIQTCLRASTSNTVTLAQQRVLKNDYGVTLAQADDILGALQAHVLATPLRTDTIAAFMATCKAGGARDMGALIPPVQALVSDTVSGMPKDEGDALCEALGIASPESISRSNINAVLPLLQKFLSVTEKLVSQTLSKVVISLHTYPTDSSFPKPLCRLAALRELRLRCETPNRAPDDPDVRHALAVAKQLSDKPLHKRVFGAGEGGGIFGFGGYRLNEEGEFIRHLFDKCLGNQPAAFNLSLRTLKGVWRKSDDSTYRTALVEGAKLLMGESFTSPQPADENQFADELIMHCKPGALAIALGDADGHRRETAQACLKLKMARVAEETNAAFANLSNPSATLDTALCTSSLQAFFEHEKLALRHKRQDLVPALKLGPAQKRLPFYRAALEWPNDTARAKNIQAIQTELNHFQRDQTTGNHFWSASFLRSQPEAQDAELTKLQALHPEIKAPTYKRLVRKLQAINSMTLPQLQQAIRKDATLLRRWFQVHFQARGLPLPDNWDLVQDKLKAAASKNRVDLLKALSALKATAEQENAAKLAKQLWLKAANQSEADTRDDSVLLTRSKSVIVVPRARFSLLSTEA